MATELNLTARAGAGRLQALDKRRYTYSYFATVASCQMAWEANVLIFASFKDFLTISTIIIDFVEDDISRAVTWALLQHRIIS